MTNYSSPAFTIVKGNGDIRLLNDYRNLNKVTKQENYPFPNIQEQFADLHGAIVFSKLDLTKGYYHIRIKDEDIPKTAINIGYEKYEYLRLPFGLKNAPFAFQKVISVILNELPFIKIYLNDILIYSENKEIHLKTY